MTFLRVIDIFGKQSSVDLRPFLELLSLFIYKLVMLENSCEDLMMTVRFFVIMIKVIIMNVSQTLGIIGKKESGNSVSG